MDEITEVRQLMDPPRGMRPDTAQAARERLMRAAVAPPQAHRRLLAAATAAGAAAATAAAAIAVATTGAGQQPRPATLTAWTVHRTAADTITVTLRQFRDPQGLQRSLTAAGVPALVQSGPRPCPYPYQAIPGNASVIGRAVTRVGPEPSSEAVFTIHPAAIPAGTQLDIVFPYPPGDRVLKPASAAQPGGTSSPPTATAGHAVPHPVAIRIVPADQPQCVKPVPESSGSQPTSATPRS